MFGWIKKKKIQEQKKLIFQNLAASSGALQENYIRFGRIDIASRLNEITEDTHKIATRFRKSGPVDANDLKNLISLNMELRRLYDHTEREGPEAKVRAMMGQASKTPDFDATFKPSLGWDHHFAEE